MNDAIRYMNEWVFIADMPLAVHCWINNDGETYSLFPTGTGGAQTFRNDPRDKGKPATCYPCEDKQCPLGDCFDEQERNYPTHTYFDLGPNSNTYAGTLFNACCMNSVSPPGAVGWP